MRAPPCETESLNGGSGSQRGNLARSSAGVALCRLRVHNWHMCRNIRPLFNFAPPATEEEIRAAALQYVRKVSGVAKPSQANQAEFERAVEEVAVVTRHLVETLVTNAPPRDREEERSKAKARNIRRFGANGRG